MPFIWGSGSTWKILIRSQSTAVKEGNSLCTEDEVQAAYVICQRSPKGSGAKGHRADKSRTVPSLTLSPGHISEPPITCSSPSHKALPVTDWTAGHRGWRVSHGRCSSSLGQLCEFLSFTPNWWTQTQQFLKAKANSGWYKLNAVPGRLK